jgi:hypothetical protein
MPPPQRQAQTVQEITGALDVLTNANDDQNLNPPTWDDVKNALNVLRQRGASRNNWMVQP